MKYKDKPAARKNRIDHKLFHPILKAPPTELGDYYGKQQKDYLQTSKNHRIQLDKLNCKKSYVGNTTRLISVRREEYNLTIKNKQMQHLSHPKKLVTKSVVLKYRVILHNYI